MNEKLKDFLQMAAKNEEITAKLSKCENPDDAYKVASSYASGFTKEEFVKTMDQVSATLNKSENAELTDDDLAFVAGGKSKSEVISTSLSGAGVAVGAIGAAAAAASA